MKRPPASYKTSGLKLPGFPIPGASNASVLSHMGTQKDRAAHNRERTGKVPDILLSMTSEYGSFLFRPFRASALIFRAHYSTFSGNCKVT